MKHLVLLVLALGLGLLFWRHILGGRQQFIAATWGKRLLSIFIVTVFITVLAVVLFTSTTIQLF